jgi:hypothetical protein
MGTLIWALSVLVEHSGVLPIGLLVRRNISHNGLSMQDLVIFQLCSRGWSEDLVEHPWVHKFEWVSSGYLKRNIHFKSVGLRFSWMVRGNIDHGD